jgi:hypothetical protein
VIDELCDAVFEARHAAARRRLGLAHARSVLAMLRSAREAATRSAQHQVGVA